MATPSGPDASYAGRQLRQETLDGADLQGVDFARASLEQVSLKGADLRGARFSGAELSQVDLSGARLQGARFCGARLDQVVLDKAQLDGVDLRGATLEQCSLEACEVVGLTLSGAVLSKTNLVKLTLREAVLDGASLEDVGLLDGRFSECSMVGLRVSDSALGGLELEGCDLTGASFADSALRDSVLCGCTLRAVLFGRARLHGLSIEAGSWDGAVFEGCRGLSVQLEEALAQGGARLRHPPAVRALRLLRTSRPLQIAVVLGLVLLLVAAIVLLKSPRLWPTALLMSRFEAAQARNDPERCEPMLRLADVMVERTSLGASQRAGLLQHDRPEQAEASLRRAAELGQADPAEHLLALSELGGFLIERGSLERAERVLEDMRALEGPGLEIEALRFEERLLRARGLGSIPTHPDEVPEDADPWRSLQRAAAEALLELPKLPPHQIGSTPLELLILGEWERAGELLDGVSAPPLERAERWEVYRGAIERMVEEDRIDLALALMEHHSQGKGLDDLSDIERLALSVDLHLRAGQAEVARASLDALEAPDDPRLGFELILLRVSLLADLGEHPAAEALLLASEPAAELPFDVVARRGWLLAEIRLARGQEEAAVAALEPVLESVPDREPAENLLRQLASWGEQLSEPQRVTQLLERVDNPMLAKAGQGQELALTILRTKARDGVVTLDDPVLRDVLERGTPQQIQEAASLAIEGARQQGTLEEALGLLLPHAASLADVRARENLGMQLAEVAAGARLYPASVEVLSQLGLEEAEAADIRSRARSLSVRIALERGELELALERFEDTLRRADEMEEWLLRDLGRAVIDALQAADQHPRALAQARALRAHLQEEPELWFEAFSSLVAMDDRAGFDRELAAAEGAIGACRARMMAARSRMESGREPTDLTALERECSSAASSVDERLAAASVLGQAGRPRVALEMVRGLTERTLAPQEALRVDLELAGWLAATGDRPGAISLLEQRYRASSNAETHQRVTGALLGYLAAQGPPETLVEAYLRFGREHPDSVELQLWKQAALALIQGGHGELVPQLEGRPGWASHIEREAEQAELRALIDAGELDAAWEWLEEAVGRAVRDEQRLELLHHAVGLADRSAGHERLLRWLALLEEQAEPAAPLGPQLLLRRAFALETTGDSAGAVEVLRALLAQQLPAELRSEALGAYGRSLGRSADASSIQAAFAALGTDAPSELPVRQLLHLRAAEQLLSRGEASDAATLLGALAGEPLEPSHAEAIWDLLARALVAEERGQEALGIPARYPSSLGECGAWLAVAQHLPAEDEAVPRALDAALSSCDASRIALHQVMGLARAVGSSDPERALAFLESARASAGRSSAEVEDLDLERALLLAQAGQADRARQLLEELQVGAERAGTVARASTALMGLAARLDQGAAAEVRLLAERGLARLEDDPAATREVVGEAARVLGELEAWPEAIAWRRRLVQLHPEEDEGRGYALLQLIHTMLAAHPGQPERVEASWLDHLREAQALAQPNTYLGDELGSLELSWRVVQAGEESRILAVLPDDPNLLNSVAARLDIWRQPQAAAVVRAERSRLLGE